MIAALAIVLGAVAIWFAAAAAMAEKLVRPRRRAPEYWHGRAPLLSPAEAGLPFEELRIAAPDGAMLAAWFVPAPTTPARGTVICLHGVGGSRISTLSGVALFRAEGYNVAAYDSRGAGESGGRYCTYGFYEKEDLRAVIDWLERRADVPDSRFALVGKSMGAAVALQAAPRDRRICGVIAEASFTDLRSITSDYQKMMIGTRWELFHRAALRIAERRARFAVDRVSPLHAVGECTTPLLFIHGEADPLVAARYSQTLFAAAAGRKELWLIARGGHSGLRAVAGEEYDTRRIQFLARIFS